MLLILGVTTILAGCESPGSVGSGLSESGADVEVVRDTIGVIDTAEFNSYSGNYAYFSAGGYNDPLFGDMTATGLLRPSLPASTDTLEEDATMKMRLIFDWQHVYGDTLADQTFDVYQIDEYWRSRAYKLKDDIKLDESRKIASFTVEANDSLDVVLDPQWVQDHYRLYAESDDSEADSLYEEEEFGLALVPTDHNKIIPLDAQSTRFVIENPESDTFEVSMGQWAYHLDRANEPEQPEGSVASYNMLEKILNFQLDVSDLDVNGPSISNAELIFHQNTEEMGPAVTGSVKRPRAISPQLRLVDPSQTPDNLIAGNPVANGEYSEEEDAFHFDVTGFMRSALINGVPEEEELYLLLPINGTVKTSLFHIDPTHENAPKLVITYLKHSNN